MPYKRAIRIFASNLLSAALTPNNWFLESCRLIGSVISKWLDKM